MSFPLGAHFLLCQKESKQRNDSNPQIGQGFFTVGTPQPSWTITSSRPASTKRDIQSPFDSVPPWLHVSHLLGYRFPEGKNLDLFGARIRTAHPFEFVFILPATALVNMIGYLVTTLSNLLSYAMVFSVFFVSHWTQKCTRKNQCIFYWILLKLMIN